jgi:hypothetical protein
MYGSTAIGRVEREADGNNFRGELVSAVPSTAAEAAIAATRWHRRGLLGRLVRLDDRVHLVKGERA